MPDLPAHGDHLSGSLVPQHGGIAADMVPQVAASALDNLHIGAVAKAAGVYLDEGLVIPQNRLGNVVHQADIPRSHNRNGFHVLHVAHSLF